MRFKLAEVFERSRQYTDAVREYDGVISIDSTYAEAYRAKGKILVAAKLYPRAVPALTKYMLLKPSSAEGSVLLAKAYYGAEDFGEASQAAKRSLQLDSANADMWRIYAHSLVETKDYQTALLGFEGLKRKKGLEAQDQGKYGTELFGLGKEEEALEAWLAAVQADSANCDPYYNLGSIYMKRQDYVKAAEMFEKKIACDSWGATFFMPSWSCPITSTYW